MCRSFNIQIISIEYESFSVFKIIERGTFSFFLTISSTSQSHKLFTELSQGKKARPQSSLAFQYFPHRFQ